MFLVNCIGMTLKSIHLKVKTVWMTGRQEICCRNLAFYTFLYKPNQALPKKQCKTIRSNDSCYKRRVTSFAGATISHLCNHTIKHARLIIMMIEWLFSSILLCNIKKYIYLLTSFIPQQFKQPVCAALFAGLN